MKSPANRRNRHGAQQMKVDVVSNNLANMSTTGYNARRADFADLHYQQMARPGTYFRLRTGRCCRPGCRWASASAPPRCRSCWPGLAGCDRRRSGCGDRRDNGYLEVTLPNGTTPIPATGR
jgi:flagellar basal-body rod protein FlgG